MRVSLILLFILSTILFSCKQQNSKQESAVAADLQEVIANPAGYVDRNIQVEGTVTHVCRHGGQKMFIKPAGSDETVKVTTGSDIAEFELELEGSKISVTGILKEGTEETPGLPGTKNQGTGEEHEEDTLTHPEETRATPAVSDTCEAETTGMVYWIEASGFKIK